MRKVRECRKVSKGEDLKKKMEKLSGENDRRAGLYGNCFSTTYLFSHHLFCRLTKSYFFFSLSLSLSLSL